MSIRKTIDTTYWRYFIIHAIVQKTVVYHTYTHKARRKASLNVMYYPKTNEDLSKESLF